MNTILLVILILLLVGVLPTWPHSREWGYYPSGGVGLVLLIVLILALTGRVWYTFNEYSCEVSRKRRCPGK